MHIDKLQLDPVTALVTALFMSVAYYLGKIVVRYVRFLGGYAVEGMMYWASRFLMPSMAAVLTMKRYCRLQLAGQSGTLHVPSRMDVNLDIDTVYITLALEHQGSGEPSYTHENLLALGNTLLVVGDPGSGKSSLVKRLFRDACHQALARPSKSRLPVLMELKHLSVPEGVSSTDLGDWFLTELRGQVESCATYNMGACFDSYAQGRGLLVLLDGLDEVVTARYAVVQAAIQQLARRLAEKSENNVALVTMRTQFHQQVRDAYRDTFSHVLYLKPFSPTDIYEFLTRWPFRTGADENIARIYKELTDRPTLRDMCSNPLILAMYVAEDQAGGHVATPETRTEFYSRVTEELLIRRRQAQTRNLEAPAAMREQRQRILGRLAFEHLVDPEQPSNSLDWGHAKLVVREVTGCAESESEAIFRELAKETGMVAEERPGQTFRFIHLTFCEFMAAYEAVQGQTEGWSSLLHAHTRFLEENEPQFRSRLVEAIPFACGLLPRVRRSMALTQVCALQDRGLTARCFLETKLYDHDSWGEFVGAESSRLLSTPERQWDETWLRDLHLFNVVVRDANAYSAHVAVRGGTIGLDEFYRSLVASQRDSLAKLLGSYASQDAAAAFRLAEVCGLDLAADFPAVVVANCDQSPFFALVRQQAAREPKRLRLWASLFAEAALNSRVVAIWLGEAKPVKPPRDYADSAQWLNNSIYGVVLRGSLYLQYLAIALHESDKDSRDKSAILRLVSALPLLRRRERLLYEWRGLPGAMLLLALVASGVVLHDRTPPPDWLLALSMTYLFGVVYVFHNRRVRLIRVWYSIALNLIAVVERGPDHRQMMRSRWWMAFARRGVPLPSSYRRLRGAITEILRLRGVPYSEGDGQRQ